MPTMIECLLLLVAPLRVAVHDRADVMAENLLLRQQLAVLTEFAGFYNAERPHRTLALETPIPAARARAGPVRSRPVLGGLHRTYQRAA